MYLSPADRPTTGQRSVPRDAVGPAGHGRDFSCLQDTQVGCENASGVRGRACASACGEGYYCVRVVVACVCRCAQRSRGRRTCRAAVMRRRSAVVHVGLWRRVSVARAASSSCDVTALSYSGRGRVPLRVLGPCRGSWRCKIGKVEQWYRAASAIAHFSFRRRAGGR